MRSTSAPTEPLSTRSIVVSILVSILWGGNLVSIRIGVDSVPPLWSAFWRMALGVVIVTAWARHRGVRPGPRRANAGRFSSLACSSQHKSACSTQARR